MINFRFHLASLVAIFLALALGVVIGAGVVDRGVVDALDNRLNRVEDRSNRLESENDGLRGENRDLHEIVTALAGHAVGDRLAGVDIGIVAVRGVNGDTVNATVAAAQQGGAVVTGVLWLEDAWALDDEEEVRALGDAIDTTARRPKSLRTQAWEEIAARLADPLPIGNAAGEPSSDVLAALEEAGFVTFETVGDEPTARARFPGVLASIALIVGTDGEVASDTVVMPAAAAIIDAGMRLVVGEIFVPDSAAAADRGADLETLRGSDLSEVVSTVDDVDLPQGPVTVALALADLQLIPPVARQYGYASDTARLPDPPVP